MEIFGLKPHLFRKLKVEWKQWSLFSSLIATQLGYFNLSHFIHFFCVTPFLFDGKVVTQQKKKQAQTIH